MTQDTRVQAPSPFAAVSRRIESWRASRRSGGPKRMPKDLWQIAVGLAAEHGVYAAARGLGVNYGSLRRRVEATGRGARSGARRAAAFVDVGTASEIVGLASALGTTGVSGTMIELANARGERLTIRLEPGQRIDVPGLLRELRSAGR
jgi:hypothetical protein